MKFIHCADLHLDSKIETIPPEELKRMMEALEEHERRTQKKQENKSM